MIADVADCILASEKEVQTQIAAQGKLVTKVIDGLGRIGGQPKTYEKKMTRILLRLEERRVLQSAIFQGFEKGFRLFSRMNLKQHLGSFVLSCQTIEIKKAITSLAALDEPHMASLFAEKPFVFGNCTAMLSSMAQVTDFLAKDPLIKRAIGREDEAPRLYFFAVHMNEAIKKEAIKRDAINALDKANCLWCIGSKCSSGLISRRLQSIC